MPRLPTAKKAKPTTAQLQYAPTLFPRINESDVVVLAVDPGDEHVGMALGSRYFEKCVDPCCAIHIEGRCCHGQLVGEHHLITPGWRVYETAEMTPDSFVEWFRENASGIDTLALEKFILYPQLAKEQTGSEMWTSQLIGWIRWYCKHEAPHITISTATSQVLTGPVPDLLERLSIDWVSPPGASQSRGSTGDHQRSAETHWWSALFKAGLVDGVA